MKATKRPYARRFVRQRLLSSARPAHDHSLHVRGPGAPSRTRARDTISRRRWNFRQIAPWRRLLFWTWTTNPCPHDVLHSTDPSPVRCKTLVFRDSDSVWSIRRRASMCRYASLVLQTPLRFRAAATASTHQLCSGLLTGVSAATCTRHDVAATASCNAAARRPGARPRRLARRPGWRAAGQSGGAGRRRAHGESK